MKPAGRDGLYTMEQLWQFYARFNDVYFSNALPVPKNIDYVARLDGMPWDAVATVDIRVWPLVPEWNEYRILFLRRFFVGRDPRLILSSRLHEMVHIYIDRFNPRCSEPHGRAFKELCQRLQDLGWNVDTALDPSVPAFDPRVRRSKGFPVFGWISKVGNWIEAGD